MPTLDRDRQMPLQACVERAQPPPGQALQDYLEVRGRGPNNHVFLYRNAPLSKDLVRDRVKAAGERTGVKVTPHRLRHYATWCRPNLRSPF